jgi:hypothetical protein
MSSKIGKDTGTTKDGETDDIYKFLKESGNYYVSLLARVVQPWNQIPQPNPLDNPPSSTKHGLATSPVKRIYQSPVLMILKCF